MRFQREAIKALIELSTTFEDADKIINKYMKFETTKEKIAFLKGMFDCEIIDQHANDSDEYVYQLLLTGIIEKKWL